MLHRKGKAMVAVLLVFALVMGLMPAAWADPAAVVLLSATADGTSGTTTSTKIDLTFDADITGLTDDDIAIADVTGAVVKGVLSGSGKNWSIALDSVATEGDVDVTVSAPGGYTIIGSPVTVAVYKAHEAEIPMDVASVKVTAFDTNPVPSPSAIEITMDDIGLDESAFTIADETAPGSTVTVDSVSYDNGAYTLSVRGMDFYHDYSLMIEKTGYTTYTNDSFFGALASGGDLDLANEPNLFPTFDRDLTGSGIVTIENSTYAENATLYAGTTYEAIDTNNGHPDNGTVTRLIGLFVKAPSGAKAVKTLRTNGQMVQVGEDSLIDSNPNFQETVASGKAANDNDYWKTIYAVPVYSQIASEQKSDGSRILVDPADRYRLIEWYDNDACSGNPIKVTRLAVKVEYTGSITTEGGAGLASIKGKTVTAGAEAGTSADPKKAAIQVPYAITEIAGVDMVPSDPTAAVAFYGTDSSFTVEESASILLPENGSVDLFIKVSPATGAPLHYKVTVSRAVSAVIAAHLNHNGVTTDYATIQAAIDAAVDGDTVTVEAGTFREQLTITKNITLQGAGAAQTIIESPDANDLVQSGGSWKNLKNQDVYAVIGVKTTGAGEVVIKDLTVNGRDQGHIDAYDSIPGTIDLYVFDGISIFDTSATVDHVKVTGIRELDSNPLPPDYLPVDQPSGYNHNSSIFAESRLGAGNHKVTVTNATVSKFQKSAMLFWGPTLEVDVQDNVIQGYGQTLYSTGNGIQIASSDRTAAGGANGDRRGTTGLIKNNRILDIGLVIPEPGQPGSYLNLGLYGPTGILLYEAGDGVQIEGNTISGPGLSLLPWHSSDLSNDGGYSNNGIGINYSKDVLVKNNTVTGMGTAILEQGIKTGSVSTIDGNMLSENQIDIWTDATDDIINLTNGAETIGYRQTGNGVDTITGFGVGDRINVIGFVNGSVNGQIGTSPVYVTDTTGNQVINGYTDSHPVVDFTGGTVTSGDGVTVAARSVEVSVTGNETTLFIDTEDDEDAPELTVKLAGIYTPNNFDLNGGYIAYVADNTTQAYTINGNPYPWQDATLANDGDVLAITTDDSPSGPIRIHVTAPEHATVTIKGKLDKTYEKVYVEADNPITLKIENLNIVAPVGDNYHGINFTKDKSVKPVVLHVTGTNMVKGFDGVRSTSNHQLTIKGTGTLVAVGREALSAGMASGSGIHLISDATGLTQPGAKLIVEGNVKAFGGDSRTVSAGSGILLDWGNMQVKSGVVEVIGGKTTGDRTGLPFSPAIVTERGGYGINLRGWGYPQPAGVLTIDGGHVTATGGDALADNPNGYAFEGGRGILADTSIAVNGGTVTAQGGTSVNAKGGDGIFSPALDVSGASASIMARGGASAEDGGIGLFITNDLNVTGASVTASGGNGKANAHGIYSPSGSLSFKDGASVTAAGGKGTSGGGIAIFNGQAVTIKDALVQATGGEGMSAGAAGGSAIYSNGNGIQISGGTVLATGGNGQTNGAHGIFTYEGDITIKEGANVTSLGGNGKTGVGGVGLRAFGSGSGKTVAIENSAGNVYIRGGQGAAVQRASILAKDVLIATGNVGQILMEGTGNPRSIRNKSGGDDLYKITAITDPAATTVIKAQVAGRLGGSYTYNAPTKADGKAYLWLPEGDQTISASGYRSQSKAVTLDDAASVILPLELVLSDDAALTSVAGQTDQSPAGGNGSTANTAITWSVNVANSKAELGRSDIAVAAEATYKLYSDSGFVSEITGGATIPLIAGGATVAYIKVTAQDGTTVKHYAVTIKRAASVSNDASLTSVAGQTDRTPAGGNGSTANTAITWSVNVANSKAELGRGDIEVAAEATYKLYSDSGFASEITGGATIPLKAGGATVAYIKVTAQDGTTVKHYAVTIKRAASVSNDASLTSVAGQTDRAPAGGNGSTANTAITWSVNVANSKAELGRGDIAVAAEATYKLYSDSGFASEITGGATIPLKAGGATVAYIKVTAQDGTTVKHYAVTIKRAASSGGSSGGSGHGGSGASSGSGTSKGIDVYVNGKAESAGTATVVTVDGRLVTTISVDQQKLEARLAAEGRNAVVTILLNDKSDVVIGELNGEMIQKMDQQNATLELRTAFAAYKIPSAQLDIRSLASKLGQGIVLKDMIIRIEIARADAAAAKVAAKAAEAGGFSIIGSSISFTVTGIYQGKSVEITDFTAYVERSIALPDDIDPNKITTAIVTEADKTVRHVPTKITKMDDRYYAVINSLTNSTYSLISHPWEFADVTSHWGKESINDMGARLVADGVGNGMFAPDRAITRAEFASIMVKALGLRVQKTGDQTFRDVAPDKWYTGAIQTAYAYRLIEGYEDGTFRPMNKITRQEAMTIIAKAMRITGLADSVPATGQPLAAFKDHADIAAWAYEGIEASVGAGIVQGRGGERLEPTASITRAEVVAIARGLLKKSGLM
ncbi:S-layer homology domain-containing protein [Brevibacillus fluminis]|uniref:S-layer homology domain-containing protein n=1 Tax=Brevibacillus fluminis TaxID=511487 RepID=UPI003F88BFB4